MVSAALPGPEGAAWAGAAKARNPVASPPAMMVANPNLFIVAPLSHPFGLEGFPGRSDCNNPQVSGIHPVGSD
ncbi:hypothetical protein NIIDNTM18_02270 [Mycolicibacterium litorale]|uniref:Uncharacterized protein n=1 Tax=Mycolicibacterium litorale TaxID=758802 RepID=A0A6S6NXV5_9MYCO|nr:hypothetical protein NIIDNTM18_02270 [Mycolicibacterium litorale]